MPLLTTGEDLQVHNTGSHYGYSGERLDNLGATEYTLVTIVQDQSPSVAGFKPEMEKTLAEIVKACKYSPRADNLMLRLILFADDFQEYHGFKLLENCNLDDYNDCLDCHGYTAAYDATNNAIGAMGDYAEKLTENDFISNGIVFIITDGLDNKSKIATPSSIKKTLINLVQAETLESLVTVLIGVNIVEPEVKRELEKFKEESGFTQFVTLDNANSNTLAKLAAFVSKSISAQSQSLGTGGASVQTSLSI